MSSLIPVVETFVSIQGEGPSSGEPALFLRLANCNLNCVWCDTRHSWDWDAYDKTEEVENVDPELLVERLTSVLPPSVKLLVLTGGEPLLHQSAIMGILTKLLVRHPHVRVEVETNGTIAPTPQMQEVVHLFVVSPKLPNSAIPEKRRIRLPVLSAFSRMNAVLKFVLENPDEIAEASALAAGSGFDSSRVWVMPQTTTAASLGPLVAALAPEAIRAGFKVSSRLHVLAWSDARGT